MSDIYGFGAQLLNGTEVSLDSYRGKVLLIVNTASRCGYTPQYAGLEQLHRQYGQRGLAVLGFPCSQFGRQEPDAASDIGEFCVRKFDITFALFAKVEVNGPDAHPLFHHLKSQAPGILGTRSIKWNFTKFLVAKNGTVYRRYAPRTQPQQLAAAIEKLLAQ